MSNTLIVEQSAAPEKSSALRDYQIRDQAALRAQYAAGHRAVLYQLSTGGGKTIVAASIVAGAVAKGKRTAFVVHRRELVKQTSAKLELAGVPHGIVAAGLDRDHHAPALVAMVQTASRRELPALDFIVVDECHHSTSATYRALIEAQPKARLLGLSATPLRADGQGLGIEHDGIFNALVCGPTMAELVAGGWLAPAKVFVPSRQISTLGLRTRAGDYVIDALAQRAVAATSDAVAEYRKRTAGLSCIAFCCTVAHAEQVAAAFRAAGYRSACVHGGVRAHERDELIGGLADGRVQVLASCDLISEGLDVPAVGAVILLRPTQSLVLYLQQLGRGMRPAPGKSQLIVCDHAANSLRFGLPEDDRVWTLAGIEQAEAAAEESDVGEREGGHRQPLTEVHDELVEVSVTSLPYRAFMSHRRTREELRAYAASRGYRRGWVWHAERQMRALQDPRAAMRGSP